MSRLATTAAAIGCGLAGACLYLTVFLSSPGALILVYLTQLPLFLAGLWLGTGAAAVAGLSACAVMLAASDLIGAILFAALNAAPVVLLVRQALLARRDPDAGVLWYPPGRLVAVLTLLAVAGMAAALVLMGGPDGLQSSLTGIVGHALDRLTAQPLPDRDAVAATIAGIVPGTIALSWMMMAVVNAILAQGLLVRFGVNWRPSPELAALTLPSWLAILLGVAAAATLIGGSARFVGINLMIALFLPFCLAGLAVLHAAVRRLPNPVPALIAFYTISGVFGWPLLAVAVIGLLENWLGLRRRLAPSGGTIDG
jgi:Predicted membrane protein (DUF2232)